MKNYRLHRFQKQITQIVLFIPCLLLLVSCPLSLAADISSDELIQNAREYDGKEIVFQGEVIGDIMKRGDFCWVNISDGKNALGIFLDKSVLSDIMFSGDYNRIGDMVEVRGIFHRSCLEHGGDLDIHASHVSKIRNGYKISHAAPPWKIRLVLWLAGILFVLILGAICKRAK
jgi:hypothetical protein